MAKVKLHCDVAHPNKKNLCHIRIRIFHNGKARFINTDFHVAAQHWNQNTQEIASESKDVRSVKSANIKLTSMLSTVQMALQNTKNIQLLSADDVKTIADNALKGGFESSKTFIDYYKQQIELMRPRPGGTHEIYEDTLKRIEKYIDGEPLMFETINKPWLERFDLWSINTLNNSASNRSLDFRNIRAIDNRAIDEPTPVVSAEFYPFGRRGFKIPKGSTRHRDLSKKQFRAIFNYKAKPGSRAEIGRDSFILSFLLIGINNADLYNLKKSDISNTGRLSYERRKTKKDYNIRIHPYAMQLIEKYQGKADKLLNYSERYVDTRGMAKGLNTGLHQIATDLGITELTMYYARHTWATFAGELDIPQKVIAAGLGHGKSDITDIYINFNSKKVDKANKKVIAYTGIFEPKTKKTKKKAKMKQML